jgi:hypothetical protein
MQPQIDPPSFAEVGRRVGQQLIGSPDQPGQVVRDAAQPVRSVSGGLQDNDLAGRIYPAGS